MRKSWESAAYLMKVRGKRLLLCLPGQFVPKGPHPVLEAFLGLASWQGRLRGTGGAEGGEVPWLINFHLGDTLGIFFQGIFQGESGCLLVASHQSNDQIQTSQRGIQDSAESCLILPCQSHLLLSLPRPAGL